MKILLCHAYYQQRGGEDVSFDAEAALLESRGHEVVRFTMHNDDIASRSGWSVATGAAWSRGVRRALGEILERERPAVMHCTNLFPLISPSAYVAARAAGVPVIQSLHNYRLVCANSFFYRDGRVCEACLDTRTGWPAVAHACYRQSRAASAVTVAVSRVYRSVGRSRWGPSLYVTPSEFARQTFIAAGFPADRIVAKPNFLEPAPAPGSGRGGYVLFAGRLSPEKGLGTLLEAWSRLSANWRLKIVGDGPERERVLAACRLDPRIAWLGHQPLNAVLAAMGEAAVVVMPTLGYETFGRTIMEAFAMGTPVIASRSGPSPELVDDGRTGALFTSGDAVDLASTLQSLAGQPDHLAMMRPAARAEFERRFTGRRNYEALMAIYLRALAPAADAVAACEVTP